MSPDGGIRLPLGEGKSIVIAADEPFRIRTQGHMGGESIISSHVLGDQKKEQVVVLNGRQSDVASLRFDPSRVVPSRPIFSEAVLPDYMSVQAFSQ